MKTEDHIIRRAQPWLGTLVEIHVDGGRKARWPLLEAIDYAFVEITAIHRLLSRQEQGTDLASIARTRVGCGVKVDPRTVEVLEFALSLYAETGGRFEPDARHRAGRVDPRDAAGPAWETIGRDRVRVLAQGELDLDGIAKGYAVDRAIGVLQDHGLAATVNAGGDLRCCGDVVEPLVLRSALAPAALLRLGFLNAGAFAASESRTDLGSGPRLASSGIRDPRRVSRGLQRMTVGVAAPSCAIADALTKVVTVDPDQAPSLLSTYQASAWIVELTNGMPCLRRCGTSDHGQFKAA